MDHETLLVMLTRPKLTAIRDQLDSLLDEAVRHRRRVGDGVRRLVVAFASTGCSTRAKSSPVVAIGTGYAFCGRPASIEQA
jgi:hypothetical protein